MRIVFYSPFSFSKAGLIKGLVTPSKAMKEQLLFGVKGIVYLNPKATARGKRGHLPSHKRP